ncbi:hypothetical protein CES85_5063 [Ochrobactrum quorumnocens]|uniref:Uncharacterized protein n=1 Tax=Ochrobactrum quorumnocens TaxID=271865 RepID=A0A248UD15_9HYPH|nr:hypothetical protein CES85_5063 [[Ochrobactrum] quorumnocens]
MPFLPSPEQKRKPECFTMAKGCGRQVHSNRWLENRQP